MELHATETAGAWIFFAHAHIHLNEAAKYCHTQTKQIPSRTLETSEN